MTLGSNTPGNRMKDMQSSTFLSRLRRDQKGNALAIVAASIIPLVGAIGGGVDLTRAYMAEARLAQACDAAALAGRKVLRNKDADGDGNVASSSAAGQEIQKFLNYNFPSGKFGTGTITRTATINDEGELNITLATTMPTQLLRIVGIQSLGLNADCSARRSGVNVDVVLVLDVTGSMSTSLGSTTRIGALKSATLSFLDTLDDLRTQLASSGMRVRVGIVPYSQTVNVGLDLYAEDASYIKTTGANYYSNQYLVTKPSTNWRQRSSDGITGNVSLDLSGFVSRGHSSGFVNAYNWKGCVEMRETVRTINSTTSLDSIPSGAWDIRDVAPGVDGAPAWQPYILLPDEDYKTSSSVYAGRYGPPTSGSATSDNTFKKLDNVSQNKTRVPYRITDNSSSVSPTRGQATNITSIDTIGPNHRCTDRVKLLAEATKDDLESYVNGLDVVGNTYHDVGMYWGLALISPQAPFENENTYLASGFSGEERGVNRYIVFMTDGKMEPNASYSAWGQEGNPSSANNHTVTSNTETNRVNAHRRRFRMLCEEAKRTGIEVSTVAFSNSVGSTDEDALKLCATSEDHYYKTETASGLEEAFQKIAQNIGYLRVSK